MASGPDLADTKPQG